MTESTSPRCCICGEPASPGKVLGGRAYCDRHYANVNKHHMGFWRASITQIVLTGIFALVVAVIADSLPQLDRTALTLVGIILAVIPTVWWLWFFYRQDQLEPEPKTKIAEVFFAALLVTYAIGLPLINGVYRYQLWSGINQTTSLLAHILIVGFTYTAIVYFAVRSMVYATGEFDERMDGIVYGTTAALGVATLLNLYHIVNNEGVALGPGVVYVVTTTLAYASFGGLLGYFMAQAKFEHRPIWWVPAGLCASAILQGLFTWLIDEVSATGLTVDPWRSLLAGVIVALAAFAVLVALMRRANRLTLAAT